MDSKTFQPLIIRDSRINDISTTQTLATPVGPSSVSYVETNANSQSTTQLSFILNMPSQSVILDRNLELESTLTFTVRIPTGTLTTTGSVAMVYGENAAFNCFPLNAIINSSNININNANFGINNNDLMFPLLRLHSNDEFVDYNTPHMQDTKHRYYSEMILSESNPLGNLKNSKGNVVGRGSHHLEYFEVRKTVGSNAPVVTTSTANTSAQITANLTILSGETNVSWEIILRAKFSEPLLFSPFIYSNKEKNQAGIYGINSLSLDFNLDSSARFAFSSGATQAHNYTISLTNVQNSKIRTCHLTPQVSDMLDKRNTIGFPSFQRFIT